MRVWFLPIVALAVFPRTATNSLMAQPVTPALPEQAAIVRSLSATVADCVARNDSSHPVFHGCMDWHSSVHGHWALLRAYRITRDERLLSLVRGNLNPARMERERLHLKQDPSFEMPYGRAWFLLLIDEYETVTGDVSFRAFAGEVAASLDAYLVARPFVPDEPEYQNQSWAYYHLIRFYRHRGNDRANMLVARLRAAVPSAPSLDRDRDPSFFSLWGNYAHLLSIVLGPSDFSAWIDAQHLPPSALKPVAEPGSDHHLAMNYSRAWAYWSVYSITGRPEFLAAYQQAIQQGFRLHSTLKTDYLAYAHWVPQFGIYAATIGTYP